MIKHIQNEHFDTTIRIEPRKSKPDGSESIDYREIQNQTENKGKHIDKYA